MKHTEIKTYEDACNKLGVLAIIPDFDAIPDTLRKAMYAHYKLMIIAEALNDGWKPNWNDWDEIKYYPWFEMGSPSGSGFRYYYYVRWSSDSIAGSRLCFKSRELAEYAGKQFESLYKEYFVIE